MLNKVHFDYSKNESFGILNCKIHLSSVFVKMMRVGCFSCSKTMGVVF